MNENYDIPLHDIKPLLEIQEYSLYYLIALISVAAIVLLGVLYLLYRWLKHRKRFNIRKEHLKALKSLSFEDRKKGAYALTLYGATFKDDTPRHAKTYAELVERLAEYKYKKSVAPFDAETLRYIELYIGMIDV